MGNMLTNPLVLTISMNSILSMFLPIVFYYIIKNKIKGTIPVFVIETLIYAGVIWGFNILMSVNSSMSSCDNYNIGSSMVSAMYPTISVVVAYFMVFLYPIFKKPLQGILENMENKELMNYIIVAFFMMLFSWVGSIISYFNSVKNGCKMSSKSMKSFREKMDKRLEKITEEDDETTYVELT